MIRRRTLAAALVAIGLTAYGTAQGGTIEVQLPSAGNVLVFDRGSGGAADGTRISCPPDCTHSQAGTVSLELRVDVQPDPVTKDPPYDVVAVAGCEGTSSLPATSAICYAAAAGKVTVKPDLRYRPILAVTFAGTFNVPSTIGASSGFGPGYQGVGASFSCDATNPAPQRCAQHYTADQPVTLQANWSDLHAAFVDMSSPCEGNPFCQLTLSVDTCITVAYRHISEIFPKATLNGPSCPTGDGGGGGGGGTSTIPDTPTTSTTLATGDVVDDLLGDIIDSLPLLVPHIDLPFLSPGRGTMSTTVTQAASAEARARGAKVLAKGKRKTKKAGDAALKLRVTRAGKRLFAQGAPVLTTVTVRFKSKAETVERSQLATVSGTPPPAVVPR